MKNRLVLLWALYLVPGAFAQGPPADIVWSIDQSPIVLNETFIVPQSLVLIIDPGVEVRLAEGVDIRVEGGIYASGDVGRPIQFVNEDRGRRWGSLVIEGELSATLRHCTFERGDSAGGERIGMVSVMNHAAGTIIEDCTFTDWPDSFGRKAIQVYESTGVEIRGCYFGPGTNEAVHGVRSPVLVEDCLFDFRSGYSDAVDVGDTAHLDEQPQILRNRFLGGEDDAIDLDDCSAHVEGNWVANFRGGDHDPIGISGDRTSQPVIVNNVIVNCENGIGFKNGAFITVVNNTIINCDRGIWLHQNPASGQVHNTLVLGAPAQQAIVLEDGSQITVSHSLIHGEILYPGDGNLNVDPNLDRVSYAPYPASPLIDAGIPVAPYTDSDFSGNERRGLPDIGAFEFIPKASAIHGWEQYP